MIIKNFFIENLSTLSICRLIVLTLFFTLIFTVLSHASQDSTLSDLSNDKAVHSCGPHSLSTVMSLFGHFVDVARCAKLAETDPNGVTTLAGLQSAAKVLGVSTKGLCITPEELAFVGGPVILHCTLPNNKEHFMVFNEYSRGWFELIDPMQTGHKKNFYTADQLRLMWDGNCIAFTQNPFLASLKAGICRSRCIITAIIGTALGIFIAMVAGSYIFRHKDSSLYKMNASARTSTFAVLGCTAIVAACITLLGIQRVVGSPFRGKNPCLILGATVLNVGDLKYGGTYTASIWIGNCGPGTLKIDKKKVMTSCTCLWAGISKLEFKKGDKGGLEFRVTPPKKMGSFQYSAYIPSNDPQGGKVVTIKGQVTGAGGVVYPPRLYFGRIDDTKIANKKLFYILRRPDVKILNVTSDLPFVTFTFSKQNNTAFEIDVSLAELPKPGPFSGTINILTNDPEIEYAEIAVPFSGIIEPKTGNRLSVRLFN